MKFNNVYIFSIVCLVVRAHAFYSLGTTKLCVDGWTTWKQFNVNYVFKLPPNTQQCFVLVLLVQITKIDPRFIATNREETTQR